MKTHKHQPDRWDGYYEQCKCGVSAGDKRDPRTGLRYTRFEQWQWHQ